jgi:hypothetical protein
MLIQSFNVGDTNFHGNAQGENRNKCV